VVDLLDARDIPPYDPNLEAGGKPAAITELKRRVTEAGDDLIRVAK
jgi:hypothetical protein